MSQLIVAIIEKTDFFIEFCNALALRYPRYATLLFLHGCLRSPDRRQNS